MNKKTLTSLFAEALYQIPDYQRGYAWEEKQWKDFIEDIDALVDEDRVTGHYTGTVVVYRRRNPDVRDYGRKRLPVLDVVDGQQRLTTCCLYLSVILRKLISKGETEYERDVPDYLYAGSTCKLILANDTADTFHELLKSGQVNLEARSSHQQRLVAAYDRFEQHVKARLASRNGSGLQYLRDVYQAITQKLHFTFYEIEEECEIGMTFELMNSRGKGLSVLELLKNYLMHWVYRNESETEERQTLSDLVNRTWKETYTNIGTCGGEEDQCLRIAWILYCNYTPKNWHGYEGFKEREYIPLRDFSKRSVQETKQFILRFVAGLAEVSKHYAVIVKPSKDNTASAEEFAWLERIHRTGNIANFLALMVAARRERLDGRASEGDYLDLLKALECFAYRVFLYEGRRSNAGKSNFYRWGYRVFAGERSLAEIAGKVQSLIRHYAPEDRFIQENANPDDWYGGRHLLKYTLFEYELHLLRSEGHGKKPRITWEELGDTTLEHILPRNPDERSKWMQAWPAKDAEECLNDIGNLVLTHDNSSYRNFDFARKKGKAGTGVGYGNSDIRQERKLAAYEDWTRAEFNKRRKMLVAWINERWSTKLSDDAVSVDVNDEADEDETGG